MTGEKIQARYHMPMQLKWSVLIGGIALLAGLLLSLVVVTRVRSDIVDGARRSLTLLAQQQLNYLETFIESRQSRVEILASDRLVDLIIRHPARRSDLRTVLRARIAGIRDHEPWVSNFVIARHDRLLHSDAELAEDSVAKILTLFNSLPGRGVSVVANEDLGANEPPGYSLVLKRPVVDLGDHGGVAYVALVLSLGRINSDLYLRGASTAARGSLVFGHIEGAMQAGLLAPTAPLDLLQGAPLSELKEMAREAGYVAEYQVISSGLLGVVCFVSESETLAPVYHALQYLLGASLLFSLLAGVVGGFWAGSIVHSFEGVARRIGQVAGNHIPSRLRREPIRDLSGLSDACEAVTASMTTRIADLEFIKSSLEKVVQIKSLNLLGEVLEDQIQMHLGLPDTQVFCSNAPLEDLVINGRVFDPRKGEDDGPEEEYFRFLRRPSSQDVHGIIVISSLDNRHPDCRRLRNLVDHLADSAEMVIELACTNREDLERDRRFYSEKLDKALRDVLQAHPYPSPSQYDLAGLFRPGIEPGGTWHGAWLSCSEERLRIYLGDATGHGPVSALISIGAMAIISTLEAEAHARGQELLDAEQTLQHVDNFIRGVGQQKFLMTFCICDICLATGEMTFINAGNKQPFILSAPLSQKEEAVRFVTALGNRLGWVQPGDRPPIFQKKVTFIEPGETLVLYADGTISMRDTEGKKLGLVALQKMCMRQMGKSSKTMCEGVFADVVAFQGDPQPRDDINLVIVKRGSAV